MKTWFLKDNFAAEKEKEEKGRVGDVSLLEYITTAKPVNEKSD